MSQPYPRGVSGIPCPTSFLDWLSKRWGAVWDLSAGKEVADGLISRFCPKVELNRLGGNWDIGLTTLGIGVVYFL